MEQTKSPGTPTGYRRQKQIEDCLYENLLHSPYQSISVSDICRQVGISRKAFYNYYRDKDACLSAIIDRLLQEALLHVATTLPDDTTSLNAAIVLLDFWKGKKDFFDVMVRNDLLNFLLLRSTQYILNEDRTTLALLNTPEVQSDGDILACYMSCQITLVLQWHFRNYETPTEEMARKLLRLLHVPMIALPETEK